MAAVGGAIDTTYSGFDSPVPDVHANIRSSIYISNKESCGTDHQTRNEEGRGKTTVGEEPSIGAETIVASSHTTDKNDTPGTNAGHATCSDDRSTSDNGDDASGAETSACHSHAPVVLQRRLRRVGEDEPILSSDIQAGFDVPAKRGIVQGEAHAVESIYSKPYIEPDTLDTVPTEERKQESRYQFAVTSSSDAEGDEDDDVGRQIDFELEALSVSVAKLRRLAEAMGREIEMQNQTLARMCSSSADDQQAADKAVEGC